MSGCKIKEEYIMSMTINHNLAAMNTNRQLAINGENTSKSLEKLSSGLRINRAGDDAAGLAISEKMRGQIKGLNQASRNAQDSISLIQTGEGALNETHDILQRMREIAVQSSNDTNTSTDRTALQDEMKQLTSEVDRIANTTEFNTKKLLNGDLAGVQDAKAGTLVKEGTFANGTVALGAVTGVSIAAQTDVIRLNVVKMSAGSTFTDGASISISTVLGNIAPGKVALSTSAIVVSDGANTINIALTNADSVKSGDTITISLKAAQAEKTDSSKQVRAQIGANAGQELGIGINDMTSKALAVRATNGDALDVTNQGSASGAVTIINNAIEQVSTERSKLGAFQNRLEHTIKNLDTSSENLQASESRVRDVDMAKEMMNYQKNNTLQQAAQAMLAQANQSSQGVLQLLR